MLFNTLEFFAFLVVVLALFYTFPMSWRKPLLLIASYFFYLSWNPKFILLLLTLTVTDYVAALWIGRLEGPGRKTALVFGLAANLGFLGFFKYYNFAASNLAHLIGKPDHAFYLDIVLPLGISFHTFQSMSYLVDVYRRQQEVIRNPLDYALFIAFFPQLVAGPIVRAREFFVDLLPWRPPSVDDLREGLLLIVLGLTKKMALADQFAQVADPYFKDLPHHPGTLTAWTGVGAFAMQIFFDFSGYTDMAIGFAKLFGFHFPMNFARPYLATGITDFWHRWHMSLSRWLRDYLYIPLGGNRGSLLFTYRNLMLTMLLGGLWHGASWNFVIWGGYHGLLLSIGRMMRGKGAAKPVPLWRWPIQVAFTFVLASIGWVFFRAATFNDSATVLRAMFSLAPGTSLLAPRHWLFIALSFVLALAEERYALSDRLVRGPRWRQAAALGATLFFLELFAVMDERIPFIYFQF